jgi:hypothetical protein
MRFDDLLARHLDGELPPRESEPLWEAILSEPKAREEYLAARSIDADLRRLLGPSSSAESFLAGALNSRKKKDTRRFLRTVQRRAAGRRGSERAAWAVAAIAASAAALALCFLSTSDEPAPKPVPSVVREAPAVPPPPPIPRDERVPPPEEPCPEIPRLPEPRRAPPLPRPAPEPQIVELPAPAPKPPEPPPPAPEKKTLSPVARFEPDRRDVYPEETLSVDRPGELVYPDSTRIRLAARSVVRIGASGKRVRLQSGRLEARIARQPRGEPFTFDSAHAEVEVLGTRLLLQADAASTRVEVDEGAVRFVRKTDGRSIRVSAGYFAVAPGGSPLIARPVPSILFQEDFKGVERERPPDGWEVSEGRALLVGTRERTLVPISTNRAAGLQIPWSIDRGSYAVQFRFLTGERRNGRVGIQWSGSTVEIDSADGLARRLKGERPVEQKPFRPPAGWHGFRLEVRGQAARLLIDGAVALAFEDPDLEASTHLRLGGRGGFEIDDLQILRLDP